MGYLFPCYKFSPCEHNYNQSFERWLLWSQNSTVGCQQAADFVCVYFQSKKDLHCYNKVLQKDPGPILCFASEYAMMAPKKVTKDMIFIYVPVLHLQFVCYRGTKACKKLYELDLQNSKDS